MRYGEQICLPLVPPSIQQKLFVGCSLLPLGLTSWFRTSGVGPLGPISRKRSERHRARPQARGPYLPCRDGKVGRRNLTNAESISTDTERCTKVTERMRRCDPLVSTSRPSSPRKGPRSIRTRSPARKYGHGSLGRPEATIVCIASISDSSTGTGRRVCPTIRITPGAVRTGSR